MTTTIAQHPSLRRRRAGVLLHPTSLPGDGDAGTLGNDAYYFVDWMVSAGLTLWQMLPLGPTHDDGSPYQCLSAYAGDPRLISLHKLAERGWLTTEQAKSESKLESKRVALQQAFARWRTVRTVTDTAEFEQFVYAQRYWLDDYALYVALREQHKNKCWADWPAALRDRHENALHQARARLSNTIEEVKFQQFVFFTQWHQLRKYANEKGVLLLGDVPIFVAYDSADAWSQRQHFRLNAHGKPLVVAGVPPDYFSATGQRWGNPLYNWDAMQEDGYQWWIERIKTNMQMFDVIRIDHFRGFEAYWEIQASCPTAVEGRWVKAPGDDLFATLLRQLGALPLVAEDLGVITDEVNALRRKYDFPGMKVLQFAFDGGPQNPYLPHNHEIGSVVYTGTHDNDTTCGWFASLNPQAQSAVREYLGSTTEPMPWPLITSAYMSVATLAVVPMQDFLSLDSTHRMNTPGTTQGNWRWRFTWPQVGPHVAVRARRMAEIYGRSQ